MAGEQTFQRRQNTLNLTRLKEEATAHRYKDYPMEVPTLLALIERLEKAEAALTKAGLEVPK